jgi:flagellin-like hook-associated protein FlgL
MGKNPFGDEQPTGPQRINPFGEVEAAGDLEEAVGRIEHSARAVRRLKTQLGAEGLTLSATRELIDELSGGLDAAARALRDLARRDEDGRH